MMRQGRADIITKRRNDTAFQRFVQAGCFAVYLFAVLWYTIGKRAAGYYPGQFDLFWSYKQWAGGDRGLGVAILANIAMFMPFGFLAAAMQKKARKPAVLRIGLSAFAFSAFIETAQYILMRGMFEFDDMINNVLGALLGIAFLRMMRRYLPEKYLPPLLAVAGTGIVLCCLGLFLLPWDGGTGGMAPLSQGLCFQVEEASIRDGRLEMAGVCFWHERDIKNYTIVLRSTKTGERRPLKTTCGISRPDVNAYFEPEDLKAGFISADRETDEGEEYEIIVDFGLLRVIPTGVYITVESTQGRAYPGRQVSVHYAPAAVFQPPEADNNDLKQIVADGILRVYNPENSVYVYWYEGSLYWIAGSGFRFEDDGTTRMELELWTTQTEKLPQKSRSAGRRYNLLGVCFEKSELDGDFGQYRVCAVEPTADYAITSITTGVYSHGWLWKEAFWPVYDFHGNIGHAI